MLTGSLLAAGGHMLIRGLIDALPPLETDMKHAHGEWDEDGLKAWLEATEKALRVVYNVKAAE